MWIPTWVVVGFWPAVLTSWLFKLWFIDMPAERRIEAANAAAESRSLAQYFANQKRGDEILENLVENGAPECLLAVRRTSDREIKALREGMDPYDTLVSYQRFHEAMKLHEDDLIGN
jgi:hypothetical protein